MGSWGAGSFENDTAMDWATDISSLGQIESVINALDIESDSDEGHYVEVDQACEIIAAAEAIAFLKGNIAPNVPEDLQDRLKTADKPDNALIDKAKMAVSQVITGSELTELWVESDEYGDWNKSISGLINRLNPDIETTPVDTQTIEEISGPVSTCAFCGKDIVAEELFHIDLKDYSDNQQFMSRGFFCHLPCINGKLHPRHIIQDWKFEIDDAEIRRLLGEED